MLKAEGKGVSLPQSIASNKKNLVEKGVNEYGDPYTIRRNEFAKGGSGELTDKLKRAEREFAAKKSYSGPAE